VPFGIAPALATIGGKRGGIKELNQPGIAVTPPARWLRPARVLRVSFHCSRWADEGARKEDFQVQAWLEIDGKMVLGESEVAYVPLSPTGSWGGAIMESQVSERGSSKALALRGIASNTKSTKLNCL